MNYDRITRYWRQLVVLALMCGVLPGCGGQEGRNLPLDEAKAHDACEEFLNAWKAGQKSDELAPDLIGKDEAWDAGSKLVSYKFLPNESNDGSNMHYPVALTLKDKQSREQVVNVTYIVGTYPTVTVFRD